MIVRPDVVLEGQQDPSVPCDEAVADKRAVLEPARQQHGRCPGAAIVGAMDHIRLPVVAPVKRVRCEVQGAATVVDQQFCRPLPDGFALPRDTHVEWLKRRPGLAFVSAPGHAGVVEGRRLSDPAGQDE